MTRYIAHAVLAALVLASPLAAQSPQPGSSQPPASAAAAATAASPADAKTATGCVGGGSRRPHVHLHRVRDADFAVHGPRPAVAAPPIPPTSWTLVARSDIDLTKYVGKKVELTGTPDAKGGMSGYNSESATRSPNATDGPTLSREVGKGVGGNVLLNVDGSEVRRSEQESIRNRR